MCVLAPVRNFSVLCFERVARNSVGSALSIRSGRPLAHFEVTTGSILAGFGRRAIVIFLPQTAGTYPPKERRSPRPATADKLATDRHSELLSFARALPPRRVNATPRWPLCRGTKILLGYFG